MILISWLKRIFTIAIEFFQVFFLSILGIYSRKKRTKAMEIIGSWNKFIYAFLFVFVTFIYIYGVAFFIHILNYMTTH